MYFVNMHILLRLSMQLAMLSYCWQCYSPKTVITMMKVNMLLNAQKINIDAC